MTPESIIDSSRPNAGRIYDYLLGGHHNFEVDRQAAEAVRSLMPFAPKAMRLQRWCLQDLATELTQQRGYQLVIDLASGLPTNDHIHHMVPPGTTVIYSDYDPVTVEYAKEILKDVPNTYFFLADARTPEALLLRPEVADILQGRRDVAFSFWGVSSFMTDEEITHIAQVLHDWSGEKSCWAFNAQAQGTGASADDPAVVNVREIYKQMGTPFYPRSLEKFQSLIRPWKTDSTGFVPFLEWHGLDRSQAEMTDEDLKAVGEAGGGYGAYLVK
jgi:hypothetical protein